MNLETRQSCLCSVDLSRREITFSFSSTTPIRRKFGWEILSHLPGAIDPLDRIPFLIDHDPDRRVGSIVAYELGRKQNFATARLFNIPTAEHLLEDIQAGRTSISCRYQTIQMELIHESPDGENNVYEVTKYCLKEISSVERAADVTVGIGKLF